SLPSQSISRLAAVAPGAASQRGRPSNREKPSQPSLKPFWSMAPAAPMHTAEAPRPIRAIRASLCAMSVSFVSAAGRDVVDAAGARDMGLQLLRIGVQVDVAGAGNMDVGFLGRRDVGVAAAGDMHLHHVGMYLADIDIARTGDMHLGVLDFAVSPDGPRAGDGQFDAVLVQLVQPQITAAGDAEPVELPARQGDGEVAASVPAAAIQFHPTVTHAHM